MIRDGFLAVLVLNTFSGGPEWRVNKMDRTLVIIKPDALVSGLVGRVMSSIEDRGGSIAGFKMIKLTKKKAGEFYKVHKNRHFYKPLVEFMVSNPCFVTVVQGKGIVGKMRKLMGDTNPKKAKKGTIRRLYAVDNRHNIVHGSDSIENAEKEIKFFFKKREMFHWRKKIYKI